MTRPRNEPVRELPSPRPGWAGKRKAVITLLSALLLAVAIGIVVTAVLAGRPPAGQDGGAAGGTAPAPAATVITSGDKWLTGPAGELLRAVSADLGRLSTAERTGKPGAARIAGTHLAADVKSALTGPIPPVDAQIYRSALKDFKSASMYAMSGKFRKANILLNAGDSDIAKVTSAVNSPVAVKESIGQ